MIASTLKPRGDHCPLSLHPRVIKTHARDEGGGKKRPFYKPLATQFSRDGFKYRQIAREGLAAMYEQTWRGCSHPSVCHEVIHVRRREGFQIGGRFVESAEVYPNSDSWALLGSRVQTKIRHSRS
jgi:hypothetical protein